MRSSALPAACLLLFAAACRAPRDPAAECLDRVVAAAERRDADAVMSRVTEDFRAADGASKADLGVLVRRTLAAYASLSLRVSDVAIERGPAAAHAKFRVRMSGTPRAAGGLEAVLPRSSRWSFDVRLVSSSGGWKIAWASWAPLEQAD